MIATYLAGTNTRRLRGALGPLLKAAPLSKSAVSAIVGTLRAELETWPTQSLGALDVLGLHLDAPALRVRSAGKVVSVPALGVVAVLTDGQNQLVANPPARGPATSLLCLPMGEPEWLCGRKSILQPDRVAVGTETGDPLVERLSPRASFEGHLLETPWDELHATYFCSYALWTYLTIPFLYTYPGFVVQELSLERERRRMPVPKGDVPRWRRDQHEGADLLLRA